MVEKIFSSSSMTIEVENGIDSSGNTKYAKKTINHIDNSVSMENLYEVGAAIIDVLSSPCRGILYNNTSNIVNK